MARFFGLRGARLTGLVSAVCGLCFLCFGYAQGVLGGLLTSRAFLERFPQVDILSPSQTSFHDAWVTGLTVGAWHLGCLVSAILTIFVGDFLGRRRTLLMGITLWTVGEIIQASSYSFAQFIVGRGIAGFGNGFTTSTAPAYQAECVKSHRKGTILMISAGAFVAAGYALSYWLVFAFSYLDNLSAAWRVPIAFQILFSLPAIVLLFFLPESPRWLILSGREEEALMTLSALNDSDIDGFEIREEFLQIKDAILVMAHGSHASLFSNKDRRGFHRVVLAYFVQVFQQGTGINLVLQYLSWILLTRMSYSGWLARLLAACCGTSYFLASFVTIVGIDRFWGRRSLMMFGAAGMCVSMVLLSILQYLWTQHDNSGARAASTVFLFTFSMFFAIGWQGMAWLYQVEIVPLPIRGPANAISTSANWLLNFIVVFITPIAFTNIGYRTWIIFAATNLAIIPLIYFFYPETAFRSLEEVDVIFALADEMPGNPWLNVVYISKNEPLWFGKRGEKRLDFNYENSSWHRRLANSSSGNSGSGTGTTSGSDRAMISEKHPPLPEDFHRELTRTDIGRAIVTTNITSGQEKKEYRPETPESMVDPRLSGIVSTQPTLDFASDKPRNSRTNDSTLKATPSSEDIIFETRAAPVPREAPREHRNSWYESRESLQSNDADHTQPITLPEHFPSPPASPPASPRGTPANLNSSHHHSVTSRTQRYSFIPDDRSENHSLAAVTRIETARSSLTSYPGRIDTTRDSLTSYPGRVGRGIIRTSSGRETYYPDGLPGAGENPSDNRYSETPGVRSGRNLAARDAGRAF